MRHFFLEEKPQINQEVLLSKKDSDHLQRVLRAKRGKVLSLAYEGETYKGVFQGVDQGLARVFVQETIDKEIDTKDLILCQGVPKGQKLEEILMHCTEIGVDAFYPVQMDRSISNLRQKYDTKKPRYQKIVEEAAKQSNRKHIPLVGNLLSFKEIFNLIEENDLCIACYENEDKVDLEDLNLSSYKRVFYIIGPEGGFSPEETDYLKQEGALSVSLGRRILRTETAGIVAGYVIRRKLEGVGL